MPLCSKAEAGSGRGQSATTLRRARPLLGTFVEITATGASENVLGAAVDAAFATVAEVQRRMSFHDPDSTLSRLNRDAAAQPVPVDEGTWEVLRFAADLHKASGGLFDPSVAPTLQAHGFLPAHERVNSKETESARARGDFGDVEFLAADRRIRFHRPGIVLDLGGVAKGFAVDGAVVALQNAGVLRGVVNAGGDLRAFGPDAWPVEIRAPLEPGRRLLEVALRDRAMATSASTFSLVRDPATDRPVGPFVHPTSGRLADELLSATVVAPSAMLADALTKWLLLAPDAALSYLETASAAAFVVLADGTAQCSSNWHDALGTSS